MWEPTDQQSTGLTDVDDEVFGDDIEIPVDDGDYEWTSCAKARPVPSGDVVRLDAAQPGPA